MAKRGDRVKVHSIVLTPSERADSLPEETKRVPLELWVTGRLEKDAERGDTVWINTRTGRRVSGTLVDDAPCYDHTYGAFVPELRVAGDQAFLLLFGEAHIWAGI